MRDGTWFARVTPAGGQLPPTTIDGGPVVDPNAGPVTTFPLMTAPPPYGTVVPTARDKVFALVNLATMDEIQKLPKTAQYCPSAADGIDYTYVFTVEGKEFKTGNCDVDLATAHPLLSAITEALPAIEATIAEQVVANEAALKSAQTAPPVNATPLEAPELIPTTIPAPPTTVAG
jgi:hypothetical protein